MSTAAAPAETPSSRAARWASRLRLRPARRATTTPSSCCPPSPWAAGRARPVSRAHQAAAAAAEPAAAADGL